MKLLIFQLSTQRVRLDFCTFCPSLKSNNNWLLCCLIVVRLQSEENLTNKMWTGRKISHTDPSNEAHKKPGMSLEETIRPLWKFTYYAGIFPEWCIGMKKRGKFSTVVLYFSISFSLLSSVFMSLFQLYQSAIGIFYKNTTSSIVLNLLLTFLYLLAPLVQLNVLFNRNQYLSFFQQWKAF